MKCQTSKKSYMALLGALAGVINGLLGAGGGMIAVPMLKKSGFSQKRAHAASVLIIFFISLFSAAVYLYQDKVALSSATFYIPGGVLGALLGGILLKKIPDRWLRRIFGSFMIYTGIRLLIR